MELLSENGDIILSGDLDEESLNGICLGLGIDLAKVSLKLNSVESKRVLRKQIESIGDTNSLLGTSLDVSMMLLVDFSKLLHTIAQAESLCDIKESVRLILKDRYDVVPVFFSGDDPKKMPYDLKDELVTDALNQAVKIANILAAE